MREGVIEKIPPSGEGFGPEAFLSENRTREEKNLL